MAGREKEVVSASNDDGMMIYNSTIAVPGAYQLDDVLDVVLHSRAVFCEHRVERGRISVRIKTDVVSCIVSSSR